MGHAFGSPAKTKSAMYSHNSKTCDLCGNKGSFPKGIEETYDYFLIKKKVTTIFILLKKISYYRDTEAEAAVGISEADSYLLFHSLLQHLYKYHIEFPYDTSIRAVVEMLVKKMIYVPEENAREDHRNTSHHIADNCSYCDGSILNSYALLRSSSCASNNINNNNNNSNTSTTTITTTSTYHEDNNSERDDGSSSSQ